MDAIDVLGTLLGRKSGAGSQSGKVLKDILGGGRAQSQSRSPSRQHPQAREPQTIGEAAKSLEELLGVSSDHQQRRRQTPQTQAAPTDSLRPSPDQEAMNDQAKVLVRAMVNAAKSDGQITRDEQDSILKELDHVSQAEAEFLRNEFRKPVDVRDFAWSVPRGMEEQVYTVSLIAIDLDEQKEANYLADLAHGLRIDPKRCNEIHRRFGAPLIFRS